MIVLGILTDGRTDYLARTLETIDRLGAFDDTFIVDDSGDPDHTAWLRRSYPYPVHRHHARQGLAAAVQSVWAQAIERDADYLFHLEDDFLINEPIDVRSITATLAGEPDVAQMLLKRQPMVPAELAAGDILGGMQPIDSHVGWVTQQTVFSLNPCVIPRWVLEIGWPAGNEREMTATLVEKGARFGVWGDPGSPPLVHHIGDTRSSGWAL